MNPRRLIANKWEGFQNLLYLVRTFKNWRALWRQRRGRPESPIVLRNGLQIHHSPHDNPLFLLRELRVDDLYHVTGRPPAGSCILDIGANIGIVSLEFARRWPDVPIFSFEPHPRTFRQLQQNITSNRLDAWVRAENVGIAGKRGTIRLPSEERSDLVSSYTAVKGPTIEVPSYSLNDAWERAGRRPIWLLKVDVEGAEGDILEGEAADALAVTRHLIIEHHEPIVPGVLDRCLRVLDAAKFETHVRMYPLCGEGMIYGTRVGAAGRGEVGRAPLGASTLGSAPGAGGAEAESRRPLRGAS